MKFKHSNSIYLILAIISLIYFAVLFLLILPSANAYTLGEKWKRTKWELTMNEITANMPIHDFQFVPVTKLKISCGLALPSGGCYTWNNQTVFVSDSGCIAEFGWAGVRQTMIHEVCHYLDSELWNNRVDEKVEERAERCRMDYNRGMFEGMPYKYRARAEVYRFEEGVLRFIIDEETYQRIYGDVGWGIVRFLD